ncbi:Putative phage protein [uncultured Candidatus Thioglobus sp.]|nr:Putative phage protein [uncultured Candidatus Thioglobus sp.]
MITINKQIDPPKDNIFAYDLLDREETIKDLSHLITADTQPFVLSVNADWGAGKTTFIKLWQAYLTKEKQVKSIYFSAWEDDFTSDPLIAILGELDTYIEKNNSNLKGKFEKVIKDVLVVTLKGMATKFIGDEGVNVLEKSATTLIGNYQKEKDTLAEFKESIAEILQEIDKDKPFIIFIDELDRCRPLYAIECLERIKHIFGIERLVFVLSIDKKNLAESIKSQYGNIDADNYLRRFIDLEFELKNPSMDKFCDALWQKFQLDSILRSKKMNTYRTENRADHLFAMKTLAVRFDLSLRQIEQILTKLQIIFKTIQPRRLPETIFVLILFETLKSYDNSLYIDLTNGRVEAKKEVKALINAIKTDVFQDTTMERFKIYLSSIVDATALSNSELNTLIKQKKDELLLVESGNGKEHERLNSYIIFLEYNFDNSIPNAIRKINFANKFIFD